MAASGYRGSPFFQLLLQICNTDNYTVLHHKDLFQITAVANLKLYSQQNTADNPQHSHF